MNTLYYGDNLKILREHIDGSSVDLIYLDPPFNSNRSHGFSVDPRSDRAQKVGIWLNLPGYNCP